MKIFYVFYFIFYATMSFARQNVSADIVCDSGLTIFKQGERFSWGGVESSLQTTDSDIIRMIRKSSGIKGHIYSNRHANGRVEGEFILIKNDWDKIIPGKSITLKEISSGKDKHRTIELNIRQSPMVGCVKQEIIWGCHAADDCLTRCLQEVAIPEVIHFSKKMDCIEK